MPNVNDHRQYDNTWSVRVWFDPEHFFVSAHAAVSTQVELLSFPLFCTVPGSAECLVVLKITLHAVYYFTTVVAM